MTETERELASDVNTMLSQSSDERIKFIMTDRWIEYSKASEIMEEMNYLLRQPIRTRMEGILLIAPSGNGKTAMLKRFMRQHSLGQGNRCVYMEIPTRATLKAFYSEMLFVLGVPNTRTEATVDLHHKILRTLSQLKIKMLIVDEVQNMLESRKENIKDVLNGLKGLSNQAEIPIVLSGVETAAETIYIDEQVSSRFPRWELPHWEFCDEFRDFLYTFETLIPLKYPSGLSGSGISRDIFSYTDGLIGEVVKIITRSAEQAIRNGTESITPEIVKKVGERILAQRKYVGESTIRR